MNESFLGDNATPHIECRLWLDGIWTDIKFGVKIIMYVRPLTNDIINWQVIFCKQDSVIKYMYALQYMHWMKLIIVV